MPENPHPLAPDQEDDVAIPGIALPGRAVPGPQNRGITSTLILPPFANAVPQWVEFETVVLDGQLVRRRKKRDELL